MRSTARILAALLAATLFAGCPKSNTSATTPAATSGEPPADAVVATYGDGQKVTYGELNKELSEQLANLEEQKYRARKQGLEGLVMKRLIDSEAKKRGLTEEQFFKQEIDDKVPEPPEAELRKMYDEAKERLPPGTTFEQVRPQIVNFLTQNQKQERARALFEELKKQNNVQLNLPEPVRPPPERKEVAATGPAKGTEGAPVTIVEFSDFQCPYCSRAIKTVDEVVAAYPGKVRLVFRHFPLNFHAQAQKAAEASLCAHEQGKFWEYHDKLFANQDKLEVPALKGYAKDLALDTGKFDQCLDSNSKADQVKADMEAGSKVGVSGTPAFFINGIMISGAQPVEEFKKIIDGELKAQK
jgi:protein-disulfide isomerase